MNIEAFRSGYVYDSFEKLAKNPRVKSRAKKNTTTTHQEGKSIILPEIAPPPIATNTNRGAAILNQAKKLLKRLFGVSIGTTAVAAPFYFAGSSRRSAGDNALITRRGAGYAGSEERPFGVKDVVAAAYKNTSSFSQPPLVREAISDSNSAVNKMANPLEVYSNYYPLIKELNRNPNMELAEFYKNFKTTDEANTFSKQYNAVRPKGGARVQLKAEELVPKNMYPREVE
jgi:hypothetical protein